MSDRTKIQWADATWNPVVGCSKISPGCANCYAEKMAVRLARIGQTRYQSVTLGDGDGRDGWSGNVHCADRTTWDIPRRWRKPRRIFVSSMGDICHERARYENWRDLVGVATDCPQHTFLVLTKRAHRMRGWSVDCVPMNNMWLGVSATNQDEWDSACYQLARTNASMKWISVEPMLERITPGATLGASGVKWVVVGGESMGRRAGRVMDDEWARWMITRCRNQADGVSVYIKQLHRDGRVSKDPAEWAEDLRVREYPTATLHREG